MKLIEPVLAIISLVAFILVQQDLESARIILIIGATGLCLMYLIYSYVFRIKNPDKSDTKLGFNAFTQKLMYYSVAISAGSIAIVEGFQKVEYNTMLLTSSVMLTCLTIFFLLYFNIKYRVKANLLFYARLIIFGIIVLFLYLKYDNVPPFFS